jgi:epsilon-lactone hydrolase
VASQQLKQVIQILRIRPPMSNVGIVERRALNEVAFTRFKVAADIDVEPIDAGGVPAEWVIAPGARPSRVIYYLHGGGYVLGSIKTHREMVSRLSRAAGAKVLLIDYRLAPEHRFPAAVEDATAVYRWLLSTGGNPDEIVIAGESAGGGLAMATLVALRDAGDHLPAGAAAISPWVDLEALGGSMLTNADADPVLSRQKVLDFAKSYLERGDPRSPLASPLYADLRGLPPLLIQVGTAEVLLDDANRLAESAKKAGVEVDLERWEDMIHMWHFFPSIPEGQQAIERVGEFVQKHTD